MIKELLNQNNIKKISKELDIPIATLYRWINGNGIDRQIKFIKLLYRLDINPIEYIKNYEQSQMKNQKK